MGLFNSQASDTRLADGALAWQSSNPQFQQLRNIITMLGHNRSYAMLGSNTEKQLISFLTMAVQNSIPGMGDPVSDFATVNRAVISGGIPMIDPSGNRLGTAYGTGNVSTAVSRQVLSSMESYFSNSDGSTDLGRTRGLTQSQRAQMLAGILEERGIKEGDVTMWDLGAARSGNALRGKIKEMREKGADSASINDLTKVASVMDKAEELGFGHIKDYKVVKELEYKGFSTSEIQKALSQLKGKNRAYTTTNIGQEVGGAIKDLAENMKDLSELFQTEDIEKIKQYAKGMGMGNILDPKDKENVRNQMRDIAAASAYTGRSPQEIAAERIQISMGISASTGGRPANTTMVDLVANAGMAATRNGNTGLYTKEEAQSAAMRSGLNAQQYYEGIMQADETMRQLGSSASAETKKEYEALQKELEAARGNEDKLDAVTVKMANFAYKHMGSTVNSKAFLNSAAQHDTRTVQINQEMLRNENINDLAEDWQDRSGASDAAAKDMADVGRFLLDAFGGNNEGRSAFLDLLNSDPNAAKEKAGLMGFSEKEINSMLKKVKRLGGSGVVKEGMAGLADEAYQQYGGGREAKTAQLKEKTLKIIQGENLTMNRSSTARDVIAGIIGDKGITTEAAADIAIADAYKKDAHEGFYGAVHDKDGNRLDYKQEREALRNGTAAYFTIGKIDDNGRLKEHLGPGGNLATLLGLGHDEFIKINEKEGLEGFLKRAAEKGYSLSNSTDSVGNLVIYNNKFAEEKQKNLTEQAVKANVSGAAKLIGSDNITATSDGYIMYHNNKEYKSYDELLKGMAENGEYDKIFEAARGGDTKASKKASDLIMQNLGEDEGSYTNASKKALDRLKDAVANGHTATLEDYESILADEYGTTNVKAYDSFSNLEEEGLVSKKDGKYILNQNVGNKVKGEELTKKEREKMAESFNKRGALLGKLQAANDRNRPPTYAQMQRFLELYSSKRSE